MIIGVPKEIKDHETRVGLIPGRAHALIEAGAEIAADAAETWRRADLAIDQGGCFETSRPTTHTSPVYFVDGVLHYCVSNMPAAVPHTSTFALNNATFPYLLELCNAGFRGVCEANPAVYAGVNTYRGHITCPAVAGSQGRPHTPLRELL